MANPRRFPFGGLIADKAFDRNSIVTSLNEHDAKIVISQHPRRAASLKIDTEIHKWYHLIENFSAKLKEFKRTPCALTRQIRASRP